MSDVLDLEAIKERYEKATEGPWKRRGDWIDGGDYDEVLAPRPVSCMTYCYGGSSQIEMEDADAEFIAAARSDVPALVAEVERLREALNSQREEIAAEVNRWAMNRDPSDPEGSSVWSYAFRYAADRIRHPDEYSGCAQAEPSS